MLEEDLTYREKLYLDRFRRQMNERTHATFLGGIDLVRYRSLTGPPPEILLRGLEAREIYTILRFRAGLSHRRLGEMIGVSSRQVERMERGERNIRRLREFWRV